MISFEVYINGESYTDCALLPFKFSDVLDATLDSATLELERVRKTVFQPLTEVKTIIKSVVDGNELSVEKNWLIFNDESFEAPVGSGLYRHSLALIEETKFLEGFLIDNLCVTHPGGNVFTDNALPVEPETIKKS